MSDHGFILSRLRYIIVYVAQKDREDADFRSQCGNVRRTRQAAGRFHRLS